ncbi:MAG: hypothetical protein L0332_24980 [Chloroflexi bacterium]|nr:hypothetical protein [Chloroflexota bacterium]MCI0647174.1 hypothetical protein [Chloroflexota bacterium]MCI0729950.1 hypothetical protein [Chloroflexota bacterium]
MAIWLGWAVIMLAYQVWVPARLSLQRPDRALEWTPAETTAGSQAGKTYLNEPFLNNHVSWDSEYYLAIAVGSYEDPDIRRVGETLVSGGGGFWPFVIPQNSGSVQPGISLSYAFFPFYPLAIRLFSLPLSLLGLNPIATATLAGVLVSMLGTLAAMLALFELARTELGEAGGLRAAFYLLIFPSSFFLAQVYTEGLFVGLAFSSLALLRRGRRGWAAVLAVLATFTRAAGVALAVPLLLSWVREGEWLELDLDWRQLYFNGLPWKAAGHALVVLGPVLAYMLWRISYYGLAFSRVEEEYFGRGLLSLGYTFIAWSEAFRSLFGTNTQAAAYYAVEFSAILLGFAACIAGLRRHPDLAWFGLLVVFLSFTSGPAQGMHRYVLGAPPLFLFLSRLGQKPAFDRTWMIASTLVMGIMATMFMFDMWAG